MSGIAATNRFAPPQAEVDDHVDGETGLAEAGRGARFLASLIDGLVPLALICLVLVVVALPAYDAFLQRQVPGIAPPALGSSRHPAAVWAWIGGLALLAWLAWSVALLFLYGQTPGKRVMHIRVVRVDGGRASFRRIFFLRWLPVVVASAVPVVGGLVGLIDPLLIFRDSRRCLHDSIAGTRVVTAASSVDATWRGDPKYAAYNLRTISF